MNTSTIKIVDKVLGGLLMIDSKDSLREYLLQDKLALGIQGKRPRLFRDEIWRFQILLRKAEYSSNCSKGILGKIYKGWTRFRYHQYSVKLGLSIPLNVFGKGLSIAHYGSIVVNSNAKIGDNCRIQDSTTIGATSGSEKAPIIGENCFIGSGVRIIGNISIAKDVAIGANAVVVKTIDEEGTTWAGIPAKKISNEDSKSNLIAYSK